MIAGEHSNPPEPDAVVCFKAELFYIDKGRRGVRPWQQQERTLRAAGAIKASTPIIGLKEEGVHFLSESTERTQGRMRGLSPEVAISER